MKKILVFSTAYFPLVGGAEVAVKELTDRLGSFDKLRTSYEFDLITARIKRDLPKEEQVGRVTVHRVGFGLSLDKFMLPLSGLTLSLRLHAQHQYSLAWAMMASQASVLAVFFSKLARVKLLTTLQEGDEEEHLARYAFGSRTLFKIFIRPWHRLAITQADAIQVISSYLEERAHQAGARVPVTVIPNGVNIGLFTKTVSDSVKNNLREDLGIAKNERVIIFNSRLAYKNGADVLIKSLVHVPEKLNVRLLLMGSGPEEQKLRALVHDLELDDKVIFFGAYKNENLPEYLGISDIAIRPSRSEGQGISFIEAMAAGVPIIAPPVGGIPDFLTDHETGLFCAVDDAQDLAEKIEELLTDNTLHKSISENSVKLVREQYDWDNLTVEMSQLFDCLT